MEDSFWNYYTTRVSVKITTDHHRPVLFAQHIIIYAATLKVIGMGGSCGQEEGSHS